MDEVRWQELMEKFEKSTIPDHTQGVLELIKMLRKEVDQLKADVDALKRSS